MVISAKCAHPDVAAAFLNYLMSEEASQAAVDLGLVPMLHKVTTPPVLSLTGEAGATATLDSDDGYVPYFDWSSPTMLGRPDAEHAVAAAGRQDDAGRLHTTTVDADRDAFLRRTSREMSIAHVGPSHPRRRMRRPLGHDRDRRAAPPKGKPREATAATRRPPLRGPGPAPLRGGRPVADTAVAAVLFYKWDGVSAATWFGLDNYLRFFTDPVLRSTLGNVLVLLVFFSLLPIALGLLSAALFTNAKRRGWRSSVGSSSSPRCSRVSSSRSCSSGCMRRTVPINEALRAVASASSRRTARRLHLGASGRWPHRHVGDLRFLHGAPHRGYLLDLHRSLRGGADGRRGADPRVLLRDASGVCAARSRSPSPSRSRPRCVRSISSGSRRAAARARRRRPPAVALYKAAFVNPDVGQAAAIGVVMPCCAWRIALAINARIGKGVSRMTPEHREDPNYVVLSVMALIVLWPVGTFIAAALSPTAPAVLPWPAVGEFATAWNSAEFARSMTVSAASRSSSSWSVSSSPCSWLRLRRPRHRGRAVLFPLVLLGMMISLEAIIVPLYYQFRTFGLTDNLLGVILIHRGLGVPFGIFWMRAASGVSRAPCSSRPSSTAPGPSGCCGRSRRRTSCPPSTR